MACPRGRTVNCVETQFGTNYLGHFVVVNRLVPLLAEITDDPASTTGVFAYALDADRAQALWTVSERLIGERSD